MKRELADVVILGGGPAGCATALALRRHDPSLSVVLAEASEYREARIGESLPPQARPLLEHLGVWEAFLAEAHEKAHGTSAAWGDAEPYDNEFLFSPHGEGWHLDRHRFDAFLATQAEAAGCTLLQGTRYRSHRWEQGRARLELSPSERCSAGALTARFVVDATGRPAAFARRQGAERVYFDHLLGLYLFFELPGPDALPSTHTLVEAAEHGWWYRARLPGDRLVVALMSDADVVAERGLRERERWLEELRRTRATRKVLEVAEPGPGPTVHAAQSQLLSPAAASVRSAAGRRAGGWLAVGDGASAYDPLSSHGIFKALRFGTYAAYAAADFLDGKDESLEKYATRVKRDFEGYLESRVRYYRQETRWPQAPFWARRHGALQIAPEQLLQTREDAPEAALRDPTHHLPSADLRRLVELCDPPSPAHEVVSSYRQGRTDPVSDYRIIQALQHLIGEGVLEASATE